MLASLTLHEISHGLGLNYEITKKAFTRTKEKIKKEGIQLDVPFILQSRERLTSVHKAIYLIFNEGYNATSGEYLVKYELCHEAIQLTKTLLEQPETHNTETYALMSLMLFNFARFPARTAKNGVLLNLSEQDRSLWDKDLIGSGFFYLNKSKNKSYLSSYHVEAAIASHHCSCMDFKNTNREGIAKLYSTLESINPSPFVSLNKLIAMSYTNGVSKTLSLLNEKQLKNQLDDYYLYHITLGKFHHRLGDLSKAKKHFLIGYNMTKVKTEKHYIEGLIDQI